MILIMKRWLVWCAVCLRRRRQRSELDRLDDHLLQDIGVSRREASAEARKPFWR